MKLEGGFQNLVHLKDGIVVKEYLEGSILGMTPRERKHRERRGLLKFGGVIAPMFLGMNSTEIRQEYIEGVNVDTLLKTDGVEKDKITSAMGLLLRRIHATKNRWGTYIHGEFCPNNIILAPKGMYVIDWETSGYGSPYEDFAHMDLFGFRKYGLSHYAFYQGYGEMPDEDMVRDFVVRKIRRFIDADPKRFEKRLARREWFETHIVNTLRDYEPHPNKLEQAHLPLH